MLRCDAAKVGLLTVLAKPMIHDTNLIIIHRHGHRGGQPGRRLRRDQRAFPESRVELGEIGEAAGDAVYAGMLGAVTELDRKSVVSGKSVSVRVDLGGRRNIKKTNKNNNQK